VLTQHEVRRQVASRPRLDQGGRVGAKLDEEITQLLTLESVQRNLRHAPDFKTPRGRDHPSFAHATGEPAPMRRRNETSRMRNAGFTLSTRSAGRFASLNRTTRQRRSA